MVTCNIYAPREDSFLLEGHVRKLAYGSVLDMGTGSGIQAIAAAENEKVSSVIAVDVQKGVIDYCKKNIKNRKIRFLLSDLFSFLKGKYKNKKFDTIIFNPPYLPFDLKVKDITIDGGKKGYEIIEKFLNDAGSKLKENGMMILLFSSLTNKEKVDELIEKNLFEKEALSGIHIFFEEIYVYRIFKSILLTEIEKKGIKDARYFSKGKRGLVYTGRIGKRILAIKTKNPKSKSPESISNEAEWLKLLNKLSIGPKLFCSSENFFSYDFVEGMFIEEYMKKTGRKKIISALSKIIRQLHKMDIAGINKEEMHRPYKHIIIAKKENPVMIDFERCRRSIDSKNVTQFCHFLSNSRITEMLKNKKINIDSMMLRELAKIYKRKRNTENIKKIIELLNGKLRD